jgi:hypothetical protein
MSEKIIQSPLSALFLLLPQFGVIPAIQCDESSRNWGPSRAAMTTLVQISEARTAARQSLPWTALNLFMVALVVIVSFKATSASTPHHKFKYNESYNQAYSEICKNNLQGPNKDNSDHVKLRCCILCTASSSSDDLESIIAIIPRLLEVISIRGFANEIGGNPETLIIKSYSISNIRRPRGPPYSV